MEVVVEKILALLDENYKTEVVCYLRHENAQQLLIATMLSAQCTDARVNEVTQSLFVKYPSMEAFAQANISELEQSIFSTGFYHNKAKNIIACAKMCVEKYGGNVPGTIEELTALPGVGRKTANVVLGNIYHIPSIVVDTHVLRISQRLGITKETTPEKVEQDLMRALPEEHWILYNIQIIRLGRELCVARNPKCSVCFLQEVCVGKIIR